MKKGSFFLIPLLLYFSCKQASDKTASGNTETVDSTQFFQLTQYLNTQIKAVNQTPYFIYKIDIVNGKQDSIAIDNSIFNEISAKFLKPDISEPRLKKYYKENIFHDQTTQSYTISYATTNKELEVQNAEVLLNEDGQTVKRLFIRKFYYYPDSSIIEQLSWKPDENFQINRLVKGPGEREDSHQTIVVWNGKS